MSESPDTDADSSTATSTTDPTAVADPSGGLLPGGSVRQHLNYAALAVLALFAVVAAVRLYAEASRAIGIWVTPEYRPLVQVAFNLVVLLVAGAGILWQLRRLGE